MPAKKVLIVEDNALNRLLIREFFVSQGCEVLEAPDGETGLSLAQAHQPDLIIMDIQLPGIDGLETTRRIKAVPKLSQVPVLVITGHALPEYRKRAEEVGCAGFILKPYRMKDIKEALDGIMDL